jgi:hypothetical protein
MQAPQAVTLVTRRAPGRCSPREASIDEAQ